MDNGQSRLKRNRTEHEGMESMEGMKEHHAMEHSISSGHVKMAHGNHGSHNAVMDI